MKKSWLAKIGSCIFILFLTSMACNLINGNKAAPTKTPSFQITLQPISPSIETVSASKTPPAPQQPNGYYDGISFSYDQSLAKDVSADVIPATNPASDNQPLFAVNPNMDEFVFHDYILNKSALKPRILVFSTQEYEKLGGDTITQEINGLKKLLAAHPSSSSGRLPYLPMENAAEVFHSQFKYIQFQNGEGVRFLTKFAQDVSPITNDALFYSFQGITKDGTYYISAFLPVNNSILAANYDEYIKTQDPNTLAQNYEKYVSTIQEQLNQQKGDSFNPRLDLLDAMMGSLKIDK